MPPEHRPRNLRQDARQTGHPLVVGGDVLFPPAFVHAPASFLQQDAYVHPVPPEARRTAAVRLVSPQLRSGIMLDGPQILHRLLALTLPQEHQSKDGLSAKTQEGSKARLARPLIAKDLARSNSPAR